VVWQKRMSPEEFAEFHQAYKAFGSLPGAMRTLSKEMGVAETTLYHYRTGNAVPSSPRAAEIRGAIAKIMERGGPVAPPRGGATRGNHAPRRGRPPKKMGRPPKIAREKRGANHLLTPAENDALRRRLAAVLTRHKLSIPKFAAQYGFATSSALYLFLNKTGGITSRTQEKLEKALAHLEGPGTGLAVVPRQRELPLGVSPTPTPREPSNHTMRIRAVLEASNHHHGSGEAGEPVPASADELLRKWGAEAIRFVVSQATQTSKGRSEP